MCVCVCVDIMIMITHFWFLTSHARDGCRSGTDALVWSRRSASEIPPLSLLSPGVEGPPDQVEGKRCGRLHWFIIVSSNMGESCFFLFKCSIRICAFCRYYLTHINLGCSPLHFHPNKLVLDQLKPRQNFPLLLQAKV